MLVVDAQAHIWLAESSTRPWIEGGRAFAHRSEHSEPELARQLDRAGVARAVLVPPGWEGDRNDYSLTAARANPGRYAVLGRIDLRVPMTAAALEAWFAQPGMYGARFTFTRGAARGWLSDGTTEWFWPLAESLRMPVALYAPGDLDAVERLAARFPDLPIALDHAGLSIDAHGDGLRPAIRAVTALARFENISVKATSMPSYVQEDYPFVTLHPLLEELTDAYGPHRLFWGSDLTRLSCTYEQARDLFMKELLFLDDAGRRLVMGEAVCNWLDWSLSTD